MVGKVGVLYEDNHIIAVHKPAGLLVEGDASGDANLFEQVKQYLKDKYKKPGNVFLGIVHRLDRPVEGIVVFGKTSKGAARLSEQFREHTIQKTYHAVVLGKPSPVKATLVHFLTKNEQTKKAAVFTAAGAGRDRAELTYETVKSNGRYSLLRIELKTGRFHQIRAQLGSIGHPIAGDVKYGAAEALPPPAGGKTIALAATELEFQKATADELVELRIEMPTSWQKLVS